MSKRGGSRGRKKPSLHDLSKQGIGPEHRKEYIKELMGESDRAAALVAAAEIDSRLILLLRDSFSHRISAAEEDELFYGKRAPLGDFSSRISIAYALGVIFSDERDDLNRIRRVRNVFAHSVIPLTFENELIAKECSGLLYREVFGDTSESFGKPKLRYLLTVMELRSIFTDRIIKRAKDFAKTIKGRENQKEYLAGLNALLKPKT